MNERTEQHERFENRNSTLFVELECVRCHTMAAFYNPPLSDWYKPVCSSCQRKPVEGCDAVGIEKGEK